MTCKEFVSSVTEYLENALPLRLSASFEQHQTKCNDCQIYFQQMRQLIRSTHTLRDGMQESNAPPYLNELLAKQHSPNSYPGHSRRLVRQPFVLAACLAVMLMGLWLYRTHSSLPPGLIGVTIHLTRRGQTRGLGQTPQIPIELPRARISLTVEMPVGAMPGKYKVGVASEHGSPTITASGSAAQIDHVTTLRVSLDLTGFRSGSYRLAVKPVSWDWDYYPLRIR